ncbi:hypothetical protein RND81_06G020900 [Saponaria officinalis]|uniref:Uncharacterized protein n=1 Tax=Saponaria officinalis TaxID=3572 RepID=A0AAW1K3S0_SAPOF
MSIAAIPPSFSIFAITLSLLNPLNPLKSSSPTIIFRRVTANIEETDTNGLDAFLVHAATTFLSSNDHEFNKQYQRKNLSTASQYSTNNTSHRIILFGVIRA